jgi:hypothetical protein
MRDAFIGLERFVSELKLRRERILLAEHGIEGGQSGVIEIGIISEPLSSCFRSVIKIMLCIHRSSICRDFEGANFMISFTMNFDRLIASRGAQRFIKFGSDRCASERRVVLSNVLVEFDGVRRT